MENKKYQIQFLDEDGCGSFEHFNCAGNPYDKAAEVATLYIEKRHSGGYSMFRNFKPIKRPNVVEYDLKNKCVKEGGLKFKLRLSYTEIAYGGGRRVRSYYYSAILPKEKQSK